MPAWRIVPVWKPPNQKSPLKRTSTANSIASTPAIPARRAIQISTPCILPPFRCMLVRCVLVRRVLVLRDYVCQPPDRPQTLACRSSTERIAAEHGARRQAGYSLQHGSSKHVGAEQGPRGVGEQKYAGRTDRRRR